MNKKTKNSTAIIGLDNGFVQTPKNVITNSNLTDSAVRLFQLLIDTPSNSKVSLTYYRNMLNWSKNKLAGATKSLQDNGFLKIIQQPKGKGNGFSYNYVISSFGNLKSETKLETIEELEIIIDAIQLNETEVEPKSIEVVKESSMSDDEFNAYACTFIDLINYYGDDSDFVNEMRPLYAERDVEGMEKVANKYLKLFYNAEIAKVKNPDSNKKAFNALQDWLKNKVFNDKNLMNLYSINNGNINARFLMYKSKYQINKPIDFETEMGDYLENPID